MLEEDWGAADGAERADGLPVKLCGKDRVKLVSRLSCRQQLQRSVTHAEHGGKDNDACCANAAAPVCTEGRASLLAVVASLAARCAAMSSRVGRSSAEVAGRLTPNVSCNGKQFHSMQCLLITGNAE